MSEGYSRGKMLRLCRKKNSIEIFPFLALQQVIDLSIPINKITLAIFN